MSSKILFLYHRIVTTLKDRSEHRKSCQTTQPYFPLMFHECVCLDCNSKSYLYKWGVLINNKNYYSAHFK